MTQTYLDLSRQVLDRQIIDANHFPCGKVDDLEIERRSNGELKVTAILVGSGAASERLPDLFRVVLQKLFGKRLIRILWSDVYVITEKIKLKSRADELKLDERRGLVFEFISRLPKAWKK